MEFFLNALTSAGSPDASRRDFKHKKDRKEISEFKRLEHF